MVFGYFGSGRITLYSLTDGWLSISMVIFIVLYYIVGNIVFFHDYVFKSCKQLSEPIDVEDDSDAIINVPVEIVSVLDDGKDVTIVLRMKKEELL